MLFRSNTQARQKLTLEAELRHAIERDQLLLHYQPKVDATSGRIKGAEALIRWQHPQWGLVSPAQFVPLAEETGLIVPISDWVMQSASRQLGEWYRAGQTEFSLAINLSSPSFQQANLVSRVSDLLKTQAVPPAKLTIEVTESILIKDTSLALSTLSRLRELGVRISMDDFGTGYSSLSYLRHLPIDQLKIDRSFIKDITEDAEDTAIAAAIIALAQSLRLEVVAEGVETRGQVDLLTARGCRMMQGYYFSRPVPADEFTQMLNQNNASAADWKVSLSRFPAIGSA